VHLFHIDARFLVLSLSLGKKTISTPRSLKAPADGPFNLTCKGQSQIQKVIAYFQKVIGQDAMVCCTVGKGAQARFALSSRNQKSETEVTDIMSERYLTEIQVSERTCISLATLRRWRLENRGPKFRKFGSLVRYDEEELNLWEEAQPSGGDDTGQRIKPRSVRETSLLRRTG
jgi:predicted DNA-binding transcriptional regulator AlpA